MKPIFDKTIWVVVPVYNAEKWIRKCVRSIQRQSYTNWKTVLVNDGSTDRSGQICEELAQEDNRLVVLHTPNAGAYQARVNGILQVPDDCYCIFCDSDDELTPHALAYLLAEAERSNADLICGGTQRMLKNIPLPMKEDAFIMNPCVYDRKRIMSELYVSCFGKHSGFPVGLGAKMYRSGVLKKAMMNSDPQPKCFAEDLNVTMHLLPELERISVVDQIVYRYRFGGGTSRFMPTFLADSILMYHNKLKYAHLCEVDFDVPRFVAIELKNIIYTYLVMCQRYRTFPNSSLEEEVHYVCGLEELADAFTRFTDTKFETAGFTEALRSGDYPLVCDLIRKEVRKNRMKDLIKRLVIG